MTVEIARDDDRGRRTRAGRRSEGRARAQPPQPPAPDRRRRDHHGDDRGAAAGRAKLSSDFDWPEDEVAAGGTKFLPSGLDVPPPTAN